MRILFLVLSCVLLSGITHAESLGFDEHYIRVVSERTMDGIIEGLRNGNYKQYTHDFHPTLLRKTPPSHFKKAVGALHKKVGHYLYRDYLGFLNKGQTTLVLWKARFDKSTDDLIIILTLSREATIVFVKDIKFNKP